MPRTKTSIVPLDGEVAAGDEVRTPPRDCPAGPREPFHVFMIQGAVRALYKDVEAVCIPRARRRSGA